MRNWQRYRWARKDGADYVRITLGEPGGFGWQGPFGNMREAIAWMDEREQQEQMIGVDVSLAARLTQLNEIETLIRNENSRILRPV